MKLTAEQLKDMGYVETVPGCFKKGNSLRISSDCYGVPREPLHPYVAAAIPKDRRIRQSSKPLLNKLESEFLSHIQEANPAIVFHAQSVRFRIGNGVWYSPDFLAFFSNVVCAYEVKGPKAWDDAIVKLKVFAHQYPEIHFILAWKMGGEWRQQHVLP